MSWFREPLFKFREQTDDLRVMAERIKSVFTAKKDFGLTTEKDFGVLVLNWLREPDLNRRPSGYEPDELPGCSIPRLTVKDN